MKLRYKKSGLETSSGRFNMHGMGEVLTPDDSAIISELDAWIRGSEWKDMRQAFADKDIITDNHNIRFFEPTTEEDRRRGYTL
jgi:hypothetical protein